MQKTKHNSTSTRQTKNTRLNTQDKQRHTTNNTILKTQDKKHKPTTKKRTTNTQYHNTRQHNTILNTHY